jgi:hypothetical protein
MSSKFKLNSINSNNLAKESLQPIPPLQPRAKSSDEKGASKLVHAKSHSQIPVALTRDNLQSEPIKYKNNSPQSKRSRKKSFTENITKDLKSPDFKKTSAEKTRMVEVNKNFHEGLSPKFISKKKFENCSDPSNNYSSLSEGKEKVKNFSKRQGKDLTKEIFLRDGEDSTFDRKYNKKGSKVVGDYFKLMKTKKNKKELPPLPNYNRKGNKKSVLLDSERKNNRQTRENLKNKSVEKVNIKYVKKTPVKNGILSANTNFNRKLSRNYSVYSEKRVKFSDDTRFEQSESSVSEEDNKKDYLNKEIKLDNQSAISSSCNSDSDEWISIFNFKNSELNSDFVEEFKQKIRKSNEKLKGLANKTQKSEFSFSYDIQNSTPSEEKLTQDRNESIDSTKVRSCKHKESLQSILHFTQLPYLKSSEVSESRLESSKSSKQSLSFCGTETPKSIRKNPQYKTKE